MTDSADNDVEPARITQFRNGRLTFSVTDSGPIDGDIVVLEVLAGAGHWVPDQNPEQLAAIFVRNHV